MDPRTVVAAKRDGRTLDPGDLSAFVRGYARGEIAVEVAAAFLMAAYIRGLDASETEALTRAMVESGRSLTLSRVTRPRVDKHSTGGVADGVTLVFAPLAAAVGLAVAKLSGRGLGHTGGTLDKLESIPGFRTDLSPDGIERQVEEIGCAVAAQSADLVPADGALYALRHATATVDSAPLVAASVMSKKLAVESDLILLDVKAGSGAFMKTTEEAAGLAHICALLAREWGRRTRAAVTDMSQPLGRAVGNGLEVEEAVEVLSGRREGRLRDLAVEFVAEALVSLEGADRAKARERAAAAIQAGAAVDAFARMVEAQGGDPRVAEDPGAVLPRADVTERMVAEGEGFLAAVDASEIGRAAADLGAGRRRKGDDVDPAVGIVFDPKIGESIERGQTVGAVHARSGEEARAAVRRVLGALTISEEPVDPPPLVHAWLGEGE